MAASRSARVTAPRPDIRLPVDIEGQLSLDGPSGRPVRVQAAGSRLSVAVPGWAELRQLGPGSLLWKRRALKLALHTLEKLGLSLDVAVDGHRAVALGAGVKPTLLARLLRLPSADLRFSTVIKLLT